MSKPSSEPRYPLPSPNQICANVQAVEAIFGAEPPLCRQRAEAKRDQQLEAAPWLERFMRMEHGGVVALDPDKPDELGKTFWSRQGFDEQGTSPIPVRGRDEPLGQRRLRA